MYQTMWAVNWTYLYDVARVLRCCPEARTTTSDYKIHKAPSPPARPGDGYCSRLTTPPTVNLRPSTRRSIVYCTRSETPHIGGHAPLMLVKFTDMGVCVYHKVCMFVVLF